MDKENKDTGHIKDTGGPYENLQAIVKCGTSEFLGKLQDASSAREMSERPHWPVLGFYLTFLVANKVVMTSKNNDGNHTQHFVLFFRSDDDDDTKEEAMTPTDRVRGGGWSHHPNPLEFATQMQVIKSQKQYRSLESELGILKYSI